MTPKTWTARDERAAVVAWLRKSEADLRAFANEPAFGLQARANAEAGWKNLRAAANSIEHGDHLPTPPEETPDA